MRACSGVWVAHGSGSADRESSDARGRVEVSTGDASYLLRRVWLSEQEEAGYYYGFANEALWPLCHLRTRTRCSGGPTGSSISGSISGLPTRPPKRAATIRSSSQDYHFALVPRMLRKRFPRDHHHVLAHPWPDAERFAICPYQDDILEGLLGSSIVGFQTPHNAILPRKRGSHARGANKAAGSRRRAAAADDTGAPVSDLDRVARALERDAARRGDVPARGARRAVIAGRRADGGVGRSPRLHERDGRAAADDRAGAGALARQRRRARVRAGRRTEPHRIERYREFGDKVRSVARLNEKFAAAAISR